MSCMVAQLAGGDPRREIFPVAKATMDNFEQMGAAEIGAMLGGPQPGNVQFTGAAVKPDGSPFYVTALAPEFTADPIGVWRGGFFASFGVADLVGTVECNTGGSPGQPAMLYVKAKLLLDPGNPKPAQPGRAAHVSAEWNVRGNQATRMNKMSIIDAVRVTNSGPHLAADIERCLRLHGPERCFGEPRAIVAMQCGVAAAALLEAIC